MQYLYIIHTLLLCFYQVRLDSQQSPQRVHEDQRLSPLPALRHPLRDTELRRRWRLNSCCLPLYTAAASNETAVADATTSELEQ